MPESDPGPGISPSPGREVFGALDPRSGRISFSAENDSHCCVANGLDEGEWEVRTPAVRLLHA